MNTLITYPSAYSFWMNQNPPVRRKILNLCQEKTLTMHSNPNYYANLAERLHLFAPLHVMVSESKDRRIKDSVCCHVAPGNLKKASIVEIAPSVGVISPELTFLLAARELSLPKLVMAGNNLCGTYYYANGIQRFRNQIVTLQELQQFLESVVSVNGLRNAKNALPFLSERSNSPMETRLSAGGCLSISRGGFLLLPPELNYYVSLSEEGKRLMRKESICCDMVWPDQRVIVEYDSKQFHMSAEQFSYDKKRITALNLSGYQVISVTNANLKSPEMIEVLFFSIRKALKMKMRSDRFAKNIETRRRTIREIFYDPEVWQMWTPQSKP